jgi:hypothetical protein
MTRRERVIVWIMCGTVVCGGVWSGSDYLQRQVRGSRRAAELPAVESFAEAQRRLLDAARLHHTARWVLDQAATPWAASPFLDRVEAMRPLGQPVQAFVYGGYIQVGEQRFAIINGREYRIGESIAPTDFIVEAIEPDRVVLHAESGGRRVTEALHSIAQKRESP